MSLYFLPNHETFKISSGYKNIYLEIISVFLNIYSELYLSIYIYIYRERERERERESRALLRDWIQQKQQQMFPSFLVVIYDFCYHYSSLQEDTYLHLVWLKYVCVFEIICFYKLISSFSSLSLNLYHLHRLKPLPAFLHPFVGQQATQACGQHDL